MPCFAQSFYATVFVLHPHLSGLIHPYWSRINSEKTCPLMVFWNLSVWAFNGAENWIVPKDCWAKKMSVGGIFCGAASRSLLTNHRDCINCTIHSIDAEFSRQWFGSDFSCAQFHRSKICHEWHLAIWKVWKVLHHHQVCVVYVARERLIMYACSLPGLFIRALMRNKKRKRDLKFRPDPGLMFYLERRGWVSGGVWEEKRVVREKRGVTNGIEAWCLHSRPHLSQDYLISNRQCKATVRMHLAFSVKECKSHLLSVEIRILG